MSEKISIILPVYNEKESLLIMVRLLNSSLKIGSEIIIVHDNHTDNLKATIPPIKNGECIFYQNNFLNLLSDDIYEKILSYGVKNENFIDKIFKF